MSSGLQTVMGVERYEASLCHNSARVSVKAREEAPS